MPIVSHRIAAPIAPNSDIPCLTRQSVNPDAAPNERKPDQHFASPFTTIIIRFILFTAAIFGPWGLNKTDNSLR